MGTTVNVKIQPMTVEWNSKDLGLTDGDLEVTTEEQVFDLTCHQEGTNILDKLRTGKNVELGVTLKETSISQVNDMLNVGSAAATAAAEVTAATVPADSSGSLNNKYWTLFSADDATQYHVWYNVSAGGTDPAPAGSTEIEVAIVTDDTATDVATATAAAITALGDFGSTSSGAVVTTTNAATGGTTDASDSGLSLTTFSVTTQGTSAVSGWGNDKDFKSQLLDSAKLVLHPVANASADKSEDYGFWKAYPQLNSITHSGENPKNVTVTFSVFPDTTRAAEVRLFSFGDSR